MIDCFERRDGNYLGRNRNPTSKSSRLTAKWAFLDKNSPAAFILSIDARLKFSSNLLIFSEMPGAVIEPASLAARDFESIYTIFLQRNGRILA